MDFDLTDEQVFLQQAARDALGRVKTVEAARDALEGQELPDLWPTAQQAGWTGLLVAEEHGGAGLDALEAMLVMAEMGRVLASAPLLGHLAASALIGAGGGDGEMLGALASGEQRAAYLAARPPGDLEEGWTVESLRGQRRTAAPEVSDGRVSGEVAWVPDAVGADVLAGVSSDGQVFVVDAASDGVSIESVVAYDATRPLGHVRLDSAPATVLDVDGDAASGAWHLTQGLIAAESLGAVEESLRRSVEYAKERYTFGRAIGSYQAVKHALVEVLRRLENARSLMYYAGWAGSHAPEQFALAASASRVVAGGALDFAARELISVHGGIGATWEHDAPLFFRRAQLSRRLLGGTHGAADSVAQELMTDALAA
jgi:alkylation response protein AidB-like acyl-CoA dehydrogenase